METKATIKIADSDAFKNFLEDIKNIVNRHPEIKDEMLEAVRKFRDSESE